MKAEKNKNNLSFKSDHSKLRKFSLIPTTQFNLVNTLSNNKPKHSSCKNLTMIHPNLNQKEKKTLKDLSHNIKIINKRKNNFGSLYSLFASELFDMNLLLYYLNTKNEEGIISTLVNMLYNKNYKEKCYFYIPQLISIFLSKKKFYECIEDFLIKMSLDDIQFSLRCRMIMQNFSNKIANKANAKKIKNFYKKFEMKKIFLKRNADEETKMKISYLEKNIAFYTEFGISIESINISRNQSDVIKTLIELINKANQRMRNLYKIANQLKQKEQNKKINNLFRGYIFPSNINDYELIVNINSNFANFRIYNKNEFQLELLCEMLNVNECEMWESKYIYNSQNENKETKCKNNSLIYEPFEEKNEIKYELNNQSVFKNFTSHRIISFSLFNNNDNLSEVIIYQLMHKYNEILSKCEISSQMQIYETILLSANVSFLEIPSDYISINELRKKMRNKSSDINSFFRNYFGNNFEEAQKKFTESLSINCLFAYLFSSPDSLQNAYLYKTGTISIFAFAHFLSTNNTKAKNAFKLPQDFIDIIDDIDSGMYQYYKSVIVRIALEMRKHFEYFANILNIILANMNIGKFSNKDHRVIIEAMRERFFLSQSEKNIITHIETLISKANKK